MGSRLLNSTVHIRESINQVTLLVLIIFFESNKKIWQFYMLAFDNDQPTPKNWPKHIAHQNKKRVMLGD